MKKFKARIVAVWADTVGLDPYKRNGKFNKAILFRTFAAWLNIITCGFIIAAAGYNLGLWL